MTHNQFVRIKKLPGAGIITVAARHNLREILAERGAETGGSIDPQRSSLNRILRGHDNSASVASLAQSLLDNAGVKRLRKDAVRALEIIFGLPPQSAIDHQRYFDDCVQWAERHFGAPVLSAVVHLDEAAPHCHVLILPLVEGRMIGSDLMGSRSTLQAMHAGFHEQVGRNHGLPRQTTLKRISAAVRRKAALSVLDAIKANGSLLHKQSVAQALINAIANNPEAALMALNLPMPMATEGRKTTFTAIMTKPCKPEAKRKPIGFDELKPIGFDVPDSRPKIQTLSCVGFAPSNTVPITLHIDSSGEFIRLPAKVSRKLPIAEAIQRALQSKMPANPWLETGSIPKSKRLH